MLSWFFQAYADDWFQKLRRIIDIRRNCQMMRNKNIDNHQNYLWLIPVFSKNDFDPKFFPWTTKFSSNPRAGKQCHFIMIYFKNIPKTIFFWILTSLLPWLLKNLMLAITLTMYLQVFPSNQIFCTVLPKSCLNFFFYSAFSQPQRKSGFNTRQLLGQPLVFIFIRSEKVESRVFQYPKG